MKDRLIKYRIKTIILILCLTLLLSSLCSCKKENNTSIWLPLSALPTCFDPQISNNIDTENILNNCFEGLVRIDSSGNIQKGVANSWAISNGGLTYTFTLRNDAQWYLPSDLEEILGNDYEKTFDTQVTAKDFEFAIKRTIDPATNSPLANTLSSISSVTAKDNTTLVVTLSKPNVNFLSLLASPACMPCNEKFFNATAGRYGLEPNLLLYNGPYRIKTVDETTGVVIVANNDYNGDYTALSGNAKFLLASALSSSTDENKDNTTTEAIQTELTTASNYTLLTREQGGLDVGIVSEEESKKLDDTFEIQKYKNSIKAICFNASSTQLQNKNTRIAMLYSTNIEKLRGKTEKAEGAVPACCGLAPGVSYRASSNIVSPLSYDEIKAQEYITKTYADLKDTSDTISLNIKFVCLSKDETDIKKMLQTWQKLFGVPLSVTLSTYQTQAELDACILNGNYDVAYTQITTSEFLASDFLNRFASGAGTNIVRLNSVEYDNLLLNIYNAPTEKLLVAANKAAEEYLISNGYILPVSQYESYLAVKDNAKGLTVRPSGTIYALYK